MKVLLLLITDLFALALSACGLRGDLDRPAPLWGPDREMSDEQAGEAEETDAGSQSAEDREEELLRDLDQLDEPGR